VVIVLSETIDRREGLEDSGFQLYITEVYEKGMPIFSLSLSMHTFFPSLFFAESLTLSLALRLRDSFSRTFSERLFLDRNLVLWNTHVGADPMSLEWIV
jgi:hypothetical protein